MSGVAFYTLGLGAGSIKFPRKPLGRSLSVSLTLSLSAWLWRLPFSILVFLVGIKGDGVPLYVFVYQSVCG